MKKVILLICMLSSLNIFGQQIAYIYSDSILMTLPEYSKKTAKLDSLKQYFRKELERNKNALKIQFDRLLKPYSPKEEETLLSLKQRMSPTDTISLAVLLNENRILQNKTKNYKTLVKSIYASEIQLVLYFVKKTISDYATKTI